MATTLLPVCERLRLRPVRAVQRNRPHRCGIAGSIQRTATSRTRSATRTRAATLTEGVSCTSTADALPMTRWFVTTRPAASTTNPDARDLRRPDGDDAVLPLGQEERRVVLLRRWDDDDGAGAAPTSAFSAVSSRTTSRPAAMSTVCVH